MISPSDYYRTIGAAAALEMKSIIDGTKPFLGPEDWKPAAFSADAPRGGVVLLPGLLQDAFARNIACLNATFAEPIDTDWVKKLPASSEGRLLAGAGHSLRWGERQDMRAIVDALVEAVRTRQGSDGYCLPYDVSFMAPQTENWTDERRNYDRVGLTRGLIAAGLSGNRDAYQILRRFYDWLYQSPYALSLLAGSFMGSAHNCNNGHEGSLLMYFSPVGTPEDLVAAERGFVQDFFIEEARKAEPLSLGFYPLHTPHSYVLLAFQAWLDHYRATGAAKYLEASLGAWKIIHDYYEHVGGTIAICEEGPGTYLPGSYLLHKHTGETCGSVFWADFNHRFLQLFPDEERYAGEIEKVILNVILACQDSVGHIRYHNHLVDRKDRLQCANTCCEVMGVPFIARLPQYLYSIAADGLYVNLFAASTITWRQAGRSVTVTTLTSFPKDGKVDLRLATTGPVTMKLRIRIPSWVVGGVDMLVNGARITTGRPGTFVLLERTWADGDRVSFELHMAFRLTRYAGADQDENGDRYALEYGPVLMALLGATGLDLAADGLLSRLMPREGRPLEFDVAGRPECTYLPYWQVQEEPFTCFPVLKGK